MKTRALAVLALTGALVATPALASARTWGGGSTGGYPGENYAYPNVTIMLKQDGRNVRLLNTQFLMICIQRADGTTNITAFDAGASGPTIADNMNSNNRFSMNFTRWSGGRQGEVRLNGRLKPNGRGTARIRMEAVSRDFQLGNAIIEDCEADVTFKVARIQAGTPPPGLPPGL